MAQWLKTGLACMRSWVQSPGTPSSYFGFPWWLRQYRIRLQCGRPGFNPWFGKIPWRREWQAIPVSLPGEFHGQRSLAGYSPWGCKESDMTEWLQLSLFTLLADQHSLWNGGAYVGWVLMPLKLFVYTPSLVMLQRNQHSGRMFHQTRFFLNSLT